MRFFSALILIALNFTAGAQQYLLTPDLIVAWQEISRLRLGKAEQLLTNERRLHPENQLADIFTLQFHFQRALASGAPEDEQAFHRYKNQLQQNLQNQSDADPWQQWALGYMGMTSLMLRMRSGEQWQSALEIRRTYSRIVSAYEKYPGFVPNRLTYGLLQVALGSVPDQFAWVLRLASLDADLKQGLSDLSYVLQLPAQHPFAFMRADAAILLGMATRAMQTDNNLKTNLLNQLAILDPGNLMLSYTRAYLLMRDGKNEEALQTIETAPHSPDYEDYPLMDYLQAEALLRKGNQQAEKYYLQFLRKTRGNMYVPDSRRKLGWIALLRGDTAAYLLQMRFCREASSSGSERDAEAKREANSGRMPHPVLIEARLRFDGGYYAEAQEILEKAAPQFSDKSSPAYLEYLYRKARVADGLGQSPKALALYHDVYHQGLNSPEYFAANAALRYGELSEQKGNRQEARLWYERCLALKPQVYRSSIHAAARAGLRRIGH